MQSKQYILTNGKGAHHRNKSSLTNLITALVLILVAISAISFRTTSFTASPTNDNDKELLGHKLSSPSSQNQKQKQDCIKQSVTYGSPIHGLVAKQGHLEINTWHENYTDWRHGQFYAWMKRAAAHPYSKERVTTSDIGDLPNHPPLFPYCRVFVNHKYKFIYLRAPKTGSTSLIKFFGNCENPLNGADKPTCIQSMTVDLSNNENIEKYKQMWKDYFVFGFARNPWQRSVSSYRMMMRFMKREEGCEDAMRWTAFCDDPLSMGRVFKEYPKCVASDAQGAPFAYHHVIEQAPCLVGANGGWAADYIGRVENFDEDLAEIVKEVEKRRQQHAPDAPALSIPQGKTPNANGVGCIEEPGEGRLVAKEQYCETEEYFNEKLYPSCFRKLAHYYQQDVALLGFSTCSAV